MLARWRSTVFSLMTSAPARGPCAAWRNNSGSGRVETGRGQGRPGEEDFSGEVGAVGEVADDAGDSGDKGITEKECPPDDGPWIKMGEIEGGPGNGEDYLVGLRQ